MAGSIHTFSVPAFISNPCKDEVHLRDRGTSGCLPHLPGPRFQCCTPGRGYLQALRGRPALDMLHLAHARSCTDVAKTRGGGGGDHKGLEGCPPQGRLDLARPCQASRLQQLHLVLLSGCEFRSALPATRGGLQLGQGQQGLALEVSRRHSGCDTEPGDSSPPKLGWRSEWGRVCRFWGGKRGGGLELDCYEIKLSIVCVVLQLLLGHEQGQV